MPTERDNSKAIDMGRYELRESDLPAIVREVRRRTPARLLVGRTGTAYKTDTLVELREAHAAARDAVRTELDLQHDLGETVVAKWNLFEVCTQASSKEEFLMRPDLGRRFDSRSRAEVLHRCPEHKDLQIVIGDGLSVTAVRTQVPELLELLYEGAVARGWTVGQMFVVRHCRVGILNDIGALLAPKAAILLIGERPGLATAESLSAYIAYHPKSGDTDADRNLISNIHVRGVAATEAAPRIFRLTEAMMAARRSGYGLREQSIPSGGDHAKE
jgi:ethanolamine ammonia-lyase small subunit